MGLQKCRLNLSQEKQELQPHSTALFPCAGYSECYISEANQSIPWHWHEELEIEYVKSGALQLQIPSKKFLLEKGDCIAINSNILHHAIPIKQCELQSLVFHPYLITGSCTSVFFTKYLYPLISLSSFDGYLFNKHDNQKEIDLFIDAFTALSNENSAFEFTVRKDLSTICFSLYNLFGSEIFGAKAEPSMDTLRVKKMMNYIHEHFAEKICLSDISKASDLGHRECLRCFKRTLQISPMQYLLKYRIMQSVNLMSNNTSSDISEIAMRCGFESPSNFSKIFRRFYNCTPSEYRNQKSIIRTYDRL